MADSDALRAQRYRRHRAGDHGICRGECARPKLVVQVPDAVPDADFDPVLLLRELAARLAGAYAQDPANAALARELRATLLAIPPPPDDEPDWLEELRKPYRERRHGEDRLADDLSTPRY